MVLKPRAKQFTKIALLITAVRMSQMEEPQKGPGDARTDSDVVGRRVDHGQHVEQRVVACASLSPHKAAASSVLCKLNYPAPSDI